MKLAIVFFVSLSASSSFAQQPELAIERQSSTQNRAINEFAQFYPALAQKTSSNKSANFAYDEKLGAYTIYNVRAQQQVYLVSKKLVVGRKVSESEMSSLLLFSRNCDTAQLTIQFVDSKPEGAGVYLDGNQVGSDLKNGRFSYTALQMCWGRELTIEVSKSNCSTAAYSYKVPEEADAKFKKTVALDCPPKRKTH